MLVGSSSIATSTTAGSEMDTTEYDRPTLVSGPVLFTGGTLADCQDFILSVRKYARAVGKLRDPLWIADYVSCCLNGEAQLWHIQLPSEVTEDWVKLQKALVEHYSQLNSQRSSTPVALVPPPAQHHYIDEKLVKRTIRDDYRWGVIEILVDGLSGPRYIRLDIFEYNHGNLSKSQYSPTLRYCSSHNAAPQNLQFLMKSTTLNL
ncbi:hypothetical protein FRB94_007166 [Tulasnella sp. JGI-2019a]|nr:hypothetical protein FRB94_007166 [Tulasnella sp. JGI-2019a]